MKKILTLFFIIFPILIAFSCSKNSYDKINCPDKITFDESGYPLPEISVGNKVREWNEFYFVNKDEFVYIFDGKIYLTKNAPEQFNSSIDIILKDDIYVKKNMKIEKIFNEFESAELSIMSKRIYPDQIIRYTFTYYPKNTKGILTSISSDTPEYISFNNDNSFYVSENIPLDTEFSINATFSNGFTLNTSFSISEEIYYLYNATQLRTMKNDYYGYYILMNDMNMSDISWNPIPKFYGIFDGNGYSIKNLSASVKTSGNGNVSYGFLQNNYGTVKNTKFINTSVSINGKQPYYIYAGTICGINNGIISNIITDYSDISASSGSTDTNKRFEVKVGSICGKNSETGIIEKCGVINSTVMRYSYTCYSDAVVLAGGICGYNIGKVSDCYAVDNENISAFCKSAYTMGRSGQQYCDIGSIIGKTAGDSVVMYCFEINNILNADFGDTTYSTHIAYIGSIIGNRKNSVVENCYIMPGGLFGNGSHDGIKEVEIISVRQSKLSADIWQEGELYPVIKYNWKDSQTNE